MGTHRPAYIAIFVAASLVAAGVYWFAQPRAEAVRARADIPLLTPITAEMVELVQVPPAARPADTATSLDAVVGLYAAAPILAGQYLDTRALEATPGQRTFGFGAALPAGHVAFALPAEPGQALGGALATGALVDVVAVPNALRQATAPTEEQPEAVVLGEGLVVLALRTGEGQALTDADADSARTTALPPKLASVVVAVPADELTDYATAVLTSTIYLALSPQETTPQASE
jgi:Flp pilus assembly protein CpaB